jgi:hypothetical protein
MIGVKTVPQLHEGLLWHTLVTPPLLSGYLINLCNSLWAAEKHPPVLPPWCCHIRSKERLFPQVLLPTFAELIAWRKKKRGLQCSKRASNSSRAMGRLTSSSRGSRNHTSRDFPWERTSWLTQETDRAGSPAVDRKQRQSIITKQQRKWNWWQRPWKEIDSSSRTDGKRKLRLVAKVKLAATGLDWLEKRPLPTSGLYQGNKRAITLRVSARSLCCSPSHQRPKADCCCPRSSTTGKYPSRVQNNCRSLSVLAQNFWLGRAEGSQLVWFVTLPPSVLDDSYVMD